MKVLMLCDFYDETLEFQENLLTKYYTKYGHEVLIITSTFDSVFDYYNDKHDNTKPKKVYTAGGAKIVKLPYKYNIKNRVRSFLPIISFLQEFNPDLIYVHDIIPNMLECAKYVKKNPNCKMIMDYHADYTNSGKNWVSLKILHGLIRKYVFLKPCLKYISKIFPVVPASATFLNEIYGIEQHRMELLPLGADTDLADQVRTSTKGQEVRDALNIPSSAKVIFTGGKLEPRKRTDLLIEVFNKINDENLHLIIAGQASEKNTSFQDKLYILADGNPKIHFVGWLNSEQIYEHMAASDIAVFPASQSILWQRAICMHLPLIVGNLGGQSISYLNKHDNVIIKESADINLISLQDSIEFILRDRSCYEKMSSGAEKVKDAMLNWNKLIGKTLQFNTC